jgi:phytoene dehydrogenase-like protein
MKALVNALASSAKAHGAQLCTGADVRRIEVGDGRATGVRLDGGEVLTAPVVVSKCDRCRGGHGTARPSKGSTSAGQGVIPAEE